MGSKKPISKAWNKNKGFKKPFPYVLEDIKNEETGEVIQERGQELLLQRLDMPDLMKLGVGEQMDFMSKALISSDGTEKNTKQAISNAVQLADNFAKMEIMVNKICIKGVLDPQVFPVPVDAEGKETGERNEDLMYVDEIPWDDRQELFSVIFDSEGISDFREEQSDGVGNVADVQSVQVPANGPVADVPTGDSEGVLPQ